MGKSNHALVTGLFLLALVTATVAAIYWIGHLDRERDVYVVSTQTSVSGLNPESTVYFRGIPVGKIISINFDPGNAGTILVGIEVDKEVILTKGIYATLHLKGVTGLTQLELEDANKTREKLPSGDNPATRIPLRPSITDKLFDSGEVLLKKADHLMMRLSSILSDENEKNIGGILSNLKNLTDKLNTLQKSVDKALIGIPALSADAHKTLTHFDGLSTDTSKTLAHIDALTSDLQGLTKEVKKLSQKTGTVVNKVDNFIESGTNTSDALSGTTLPKFNALLVDLQSTSQQVKRIAMMLENNPQALLLGPKQQAPGPGEPGYEE
ncbi:Mammalian cell entry related domain protein [Crenothrix polyspora]|uniref:Mammalian cell entry related domain protein n=1 Tax=Crenothrix polyspora TaxID=360316 RepID=A0A1R4H3R4_9GAMM|nr:MlaD family protein [Crenothrix polyspora]SJM90489.1 Mammalian cell entry related domain protein [Crenothrix polyspora]